MNKNRFSSENAPPLRRIPRWLFIAISRAIVRLLAVRDRAPAEILEVLAFELERNADARNALERISFRQRQVVLGIIGDILQRTGIIARNEAGKLSLGETQRESHNWSRINNDLMGEIYDEYRRWSEVRPLRYNLLIPKALRLPRLGHPTPYVSHVPLPRTRKVSRPRPARYAVQQIFFATDRARNRNGEFGWERSTKQTPIAYGTAEISVPDVHIPGRFERPWGMLRLELREDPDRHIVILPGKRRIVPSAEFFELLTDKANAEQSVLVFVHGFNMTFDDALRRTAQLAHDLPFQGPAIAFCWPSASRLRKYTWDENDAIWAAPHLADLLMQLTESGIDKLYIIAHSVGGRVVADAMQIMSSLGTPTIQVVALAAPDVDSDVFVHRSRFMCKLARNITLYASSRDWALRISRLFHGRQRAGEATPILICKGVDSIDATTVNTDWLGHGYFASSIELLEDVKETFDGQAPPRTLLEAVRSAAGRYWRFRTPAVVSGVP